MKKPFHIPLNISNCGKYALIPGDPDRVKNIFEFFCNNLDATPLDINLKPEVRNREFFARNIKILGETVTIMSTGIGGPSTAIAIEELMQLGVHTFIRVGTTGAIQPQIQEKSIIITLGAVRYEGTSSHFVPLAYPAYSNPIVYLSLLSAASKLRNRKQLQVYSGTTVCSDTFYQGQSRTETFTPTIPNNLINMHEWQKIGVLNYDMESSVVLTMTSISGARAGVITGVLVNRERNEYPIIETIQEAEENAIEVACNALVQLIEWDRSKKIQINLPNFWDPDKI
jgi:uridine phosphorylase